MKRIILFLALFFFYSCVSDKCKFSDDDLTLLKSMFEKYRQDGINAGRIADTNVVLTLAFDKSLICKDSAVLFIGKFHTYVYGTDSAAAATIFY
jgi:hypothetical protein